VLPLEAVVAANAADRMIRNVEVIWPLWLTHLNADPTHMGFTGFVSGGTGP
jgi:hypothetical protein